jgi:prevent-host-death family protein
MSTVTALEAKTRFGELLERVARGEEIVITRHDKPVARIIPEGRRSRERVRLAVEGLHALRVRIGARTRGRSKLNDAEVRAAIDKGRM